MKNTDWGSCRDRGPGSCGDGGSGSFVGIGSGPTLPGKLSKQQGSVLGLV
jgi:hypothetical protein